MPPLPVEFADHYAYICSAAGLQASESA